MPEKKYVRTTWVDNSEPGIDAEHLNNIEAGLSGLYEPEFDDSGTVAGITSFPAFLSKIVSKMNPIAFYKDFKAGMAFVLHAGQLVNNGLCNEPGKYPLDAAFGKTLQDQINTQNSNLDDRTAVADLFAVANIGVNMRRIVRYNANTLNTPYKAGMTSDIDSGLAIITMGSTNYGAILCIPEGGTVTAPCICKKTQTWGSWERLISNADCEIKQVTNSYGIILTLVKFGSDNHPKAIKIQGYINKTLSAGTEYTIATDPALKSSINWYHNILTGVKGKNTICYIKIDNDGKLLLTPQTTIDSGTGMNIMECYV